MIVPFTLPIFPHAPENVAGPGTNVGASSQTMLTTGHVIVAGPAPVTVTVHAWLIALPQLSVPE